MLNIFNINPCPLTNLRAGTVVLTFKHFNDSCGQLQNVPFQLAQPLGPFQLIPCQKNRPFPSSPQSLFQSESKCEIFVMVISSNFIMNEN